MTDMFCNRSRGQSLPNTQYVLHLILPERNELQTGRLIDGFCGWQHLELPTVCAMLSLGQLTFGNLETPFSRSGRSSWVRQLAHNHHDQPDGGRSNAAEDHGRATAPTSCA